MLTRCLTVWEKPFLKLILFLHVTAQRAGSSGFLSSCYYVQLIFRDSGIESSRVG